jgi:hypothetical protein
MKMENGDCELKIREHSALTEVCGPKRNDVAGGGRPLHTEDGMGEARGTQHAWQKGQWIWQFGGNHESRQLARSRRGCEDNIKMGVSEIGLVLIWLRIGTGEKLRWIQQ